MKNLEEILEEFLAALSSDTRRKICYEISKAGKLNVNQITERFHLSRPNISHHLGIMKRAGLLKADKAGKEVYYSLNKEFVVNTLRAYASFLEKCG